MCMQDATTTNSLVLHGTVDVTLLSHLLNAARTALRAPGDVTVECSTLDWIDASALQVLLSLRASLATEGRSLELHGAVEPVARVLDATGLADHLVPNDDVPHSGREVRVSFTPCRDLFQRGIDPLLLVRDSSRVCERILVSVDTSALPHLDELDPRCCYLGWSVTLTSERSEAELRNVLASVCGFPQ